MEKFFKSGNNSKNGIRDILAKSSKALCAPSEREVVVPCAKAESVIKKLDKSDYRVIGTSYKECPKRIWFIKRGSVS